MLGAPMAGGPGTPVLAAAVSNAGGLGFLAGGYLAGEQLAADIGVARSLTEAPIGVNLFVPQPDTAIPEQLQRYANALEPVAMRLGSRPGAPRWDDDGWTAKLEVIADLQPQVLSFTFGLPAPEVFARLAGLGIATMVTVTTAVEAAAAAAAGADALVVQGPDAGGHRGAWSADVPPSDRPLPDLLAAVRVAVDLPAVAAGGVGTDRDVAALLGAGAMAVQVGTALLLADEAGTNPVHRAALRSEEFTETVLTRAFSGRYARGLRNDFTRRFDAGAPAGYPQVHYLTAPIRRAAVAAGDPHATSLWAGTGFRAARALPAAQIVRELAGERR